MSLRIVGFLFIALFVFTKTFAQQSISVRILDQYETSIGDVTVITNGITREYTPDKKGNVTIDINPSDSTTIRNPICKDYKFVYNSLADKTTLTLHKKFTWKDLINPKFYIVFGGFWLLLFIIFEETGLFAGFFLPGDSLLFVAGIFSNNLMSSIGLNSGFDFINVLLLGLFISIAGIIGNTVGYWFGAKSGPFLFERKDTFFFKKKYLFQAKEFYEKHGGGAIVMARFLPIVRTFAPIVAGIVGMDKKKFSFFNVVGSVAWGLSMTLAGHYLQELCLKQFNFDLKEHLEVIVLGIVFVTTAPVIFKLIYGKVKGKS